MTSLSVSSQFITPVELKGFGFLVLLSQFVLGGLMLLAGAQKLISRQGFERTLRYTFDTPRSFSVPLSICLPVIECLLGLALIFLVQIRITSLLTGLLIVLFSGKLIQLRISGTRNLDCGCFGSDQEERPISNLLGRNLLLVVLAVMVFVAPPNSASWPAENRLIYVGLAATTAISFLLLAAMINRGLVLFRGVAHTGKRATKFH